MNNTILSNSELELVKWLIMEYLDSNSIDLEDVSEEMSQLYFKCVGSTNVEQDEMLPEEE
jgi:hypothetical protein